MDEAPECAPRAAARALLDDPVDLQRTRAAVLGAMFGEPQEPTMIGRFEVVATAGRGAMGRVYVAFDPQLDRTVALKLVVDDGDPRTAEERRRRLVAEAQAMAQLTHPNVVSVYEVGRHDGEVFIVMQYVSGPSLKRWTAASDRTLDERLVALTDAAKGLAAAHGAGIVHRDFKPDNVVVDPRGRALVTDFGLAYSLQTIPDGETGTATGLGGTPAYMAPEHAASGSAGVASDQFAFGVTAWEVLTGRRPTRRATQEVVLDEDVSAALPGWLRRTLVRAMATEPADRWPSMEAVVAALERRGGRSRALVFGATATAVVAIMAIAIATESDPCAGADVAMAEHWNDTHRAALREAFATTNLGYASGASEHAIAGLDVYQDQWSTAAGLTCRHGQEGRWSDTMVDRGRLCLTTSLSQMRAAVEVLVAADDTVVRRSTSIVGKLPAIDACLDPEVLLAELTPPSDDITDRVRVQHDRIADARAAFWAGREQPAAELADEVLGAAQSIGWAPLVADATYLRAQLYDQVGEVERARELYLDSYFLAGQLGHRRIATQAAVELVSMFEPERLDAAHEWARHARMMIHRSPGMEHHATRVSQYTAWAAMEANELTLAAEAAERAHDEAVESLGAEHEQVGHALSIQGVIAMSRGDHQEALRLLQRGLAIVERHKPPGHPTLARLLNNMGIVARKADALDEAAAYFGRSLRAKIDLYGEQHPSVATAYGGLGLLEADRGRFDEARRYLERSLAISTALLPAGHLDLSRTRDNLAYVEVYGGRFERAVELGRQTLAEREAAEHAPPRHIITRLLLCHGLVGTLQWDEAIAVAERALAILSEEPDPSLEVEARVAHAAALLGSGRTAEALAELERAATIDAPADAETEGLRRLILARALRQLGAPREEVLRHAREAAEGLATPLMRTFGEQARALVGQLEAEEDGGR